MNILKNIWRAIVPYYIRKRLYYHFSLHGSHLELKIRRRVKEVRQHEPIRVLFTAVNLPQWRGFDVYTLLKQDPRFDPRIIVSPFCYYDTLEAKRHAEPLLEFFKARNTDVKLVGSPDFDLKSWLDEFDPDILFLSQPYEGIFGNELDFEFNKHRLLAFIPYGIPTLNEEMVYNSPLQNSIWKIFHATPIHYHTAKRLMANNAVNVCVTGDTDFDKFAKSTHDPWKTINDGKKRHRIIWAPHFSIAFASFLHRSSFTWLSIGIIELAKKYADVIQIAFKPHPNLFNTLRRMDGWGLEKTKAYYNLWDSMANTQLELGDFIDLFKTSDALIHDCGSFTAEYHLTKNPVLFTTHDKSKLYKQADDFGIKCLDLHYFGSDINEIEIFIKETVIGGIDPLRSEREKFHEENFRSPHNHSSAENIYFEILKDLGLPILKAKT